MTPASLNAKTFRFVGKYRTCNEPNTEKCFQSANLCQIQKVITTNTHMIKKHVRKIINLIGYDIHKIPVHHLPNISRPELANSSLGSSNHLITDGGPTTSTGSESMECLSTPPPAEESVGMSQYVKEIEKYTKNVKYNHFEYAINISLKNKYIYAETPKVACSTIKATLQRIELEYPNLVKEDPDDIHERRYSPLLSPSQTCGLDRLINDPEYFVFCFVRNPYTRLLSAYIEKIQNNKAAKSEILSAMGEDPNDLAKPVTFEEFADVICRLDPIEMNPHWRIQYYQTFQDVIDYDFIGRLERFSDDAAYVLSRLCQNYKRYFRAEIRHSTNSNTLLPKYYTDDIKEKVYSKYIEDFEYFGYDKDITKT